MAGDRHTGSRSLPELPPPVKFFLPPCFPLFAVGNPWRRGCGFSLSSFFPAHALPVVPLPPAASLELAALSARERLRRLRRGRGGRGSERRGGEGVCCLLLLLLLLLPSLFPLNGKKTTRSRRWRRSWTCFPSSPADKPLLKQQRGTLPPGAPGVSRGVNQCSPLLAASRPGAGGAGV